MQHGKQNRTLSRTRRGRTALLRGLAISLIRDGQIQTTLAKAKELRPFVERLITLSKNDTQATRKLVATRLGEPNNTIVQKLFTEVTPRFAQRQGGYTRIIKMGRVTPGRDDAMIEFVA